MRIAVLTDIHGNLAALNAVLSDIVSVGGVDQYWVLGDLAAFCPEPAARPSFSAAPRLGAN